MLYRASDAAGVVVLAACTRIKSGLPMVCAGTLQALAQILLGGNAEDMLVDEDEGGDGGTVLCTIHPKAPMRKVPGRARR